MHGVSPSNPVIKFSPDSIMTEGANTSGGIFGCSGRGVKHSEAKNVFDPKTNEFSSLENITDISKRNTTKAATSGVFIDVDTIRASLAGFDAASEELKSMESMESALGEDIPAAQEQHPEEETTAAAQEQHPKEETTAAAQEQHPKEETTAAAQEQHPKEETTAAAQEQHPKEETTAASAKNEDTLLHEINESITELKTGETEAATEASKIEGESTETQDVEITLGTEEPETTSPTDTANTENKTKGGGQEENAA